MVKIKWLSRARRRFFAPAAATRLNPRVECDSVATVRHARSRPQLPRETLTQTFALVALLVIAGVAVAGPSGVLAWSENSRLLEEREAELAQLAARRDELRNRVELLDPEHADPDLVGELLRKNLNVAHPDEIVIARPE